MNLYKSTLADFKNIDVSTRKKRRKAIDLIVEMLDIVHYAEALSLMRIPKNLRVGKAYANSHHSEDILEDAIIILRDAYYDYESTGF